MNKLLIEPYNTVCDNLQRDVETMGANNAFNFFRLWSMYKTRLFCWYQFEDAIKSSFIK